MGIEWNRPAINSMIADYTNQKTDALHGAAKDRLGDIVSSVQYADDENTDSVVWTSDPRAMVKEYGTAFMDPDPWGLPSLMEMASG